MKYAIGFFIGIGTYWAAHQLYFNLKDTKEADCSVQIKVLSDRLIDFKNYCGRLPSELDGLKTLADPTMANCKAEPLIEKVPVDPWDKEFVYIVRAEKAYLFSSNVNCGFQVIK